MMRRLIDAALAVLANADRPGERMCFNGGPNGEDIWVAHQEVDQSCLDELKAAVEATSLAARPEYKRFPDGRLRPFLPDHRYNELREDDRFLYNCGQRPECEQSVDGKHQLDTTMEEGPHHCFHCGKDMRL